MPLDENAKCSNDCQKTWQNTTRLEGLDTGNITHNLPRQSHFIIFTLFVPLEQ